MPERVHKVVLQADVAGFKRSMSEAADATKKIGSSADDTSQKGSAAFEKLSGVASKVLGAAAIAGAAKAILDVGLSYDKSLNSMQAVTSATGEEMAKVSELAKQLGNDINIPGASASDAAEAMTELAKGGLTLQESMAAAKGTLQLATAAQISGAEAATIQADALNAFNLQATEAGHVSDLLANAANAATGEIGDFAAGLAQSSAVANGLGISVDDTVTVLGLFANAGIKGSDAGTSFKTMLTQLQNPTDKAKAAMDDLGISAFDAEGNFVGMRAITEQLATAQANMSTQAFSSAAGIVFGSDAIRGATVIASGGVGAYDNMSIALGKTGGAAQLAAAQAQGLPGAFANIQNQAESVALSLYEQVSPAFESILNSAADALPGIGEFFGDVVQGAAGFVSFIDDLPGPVKTAAAALTAIAIVKNPVTETFEKIADKIGDFKAKVDEAAGAAPTLVDSVKPLGEALIGGGDGADKLAEGLSAAVEKAAEATTATDAANASATPLGEALSVAGEGAAVLGEALAGTATESGAAADAVGAATDAADPLSGALEGAGLSADALGEGLGSASEKAKEIKGSGAGASGALHKVGAAAKVAGAGLLSAFGGPVGLAITGITLLVSEVGSNMSDLELATNDFSGAVDELSGKVATAKIIDLIPDEQAAALKEAGVGLNLYAAALAGVPGKQEEVARRLFESIDAHNGDNDAVFKASDLYRQFAQDVGGVGTAQDVFADKQQAVIDLIAEQNATGLWPTEKADAYGKSLEAIAKARGLDTVTSQITGLSSATDSALRSAIEARPAQEDINKAWEDGGIDAGELGKQVGYAMQQLDLLAGRNGDAEAAQRAFNQSAVDYANLLLDQSLAGDQLAEATQRVTDTTAKRDEVQKNLNKSTEDGGTTQADLDRANRDVTQSSTDLVRVQQDQKLSRDRAAEAEQGLRQQMISAATDAANNAVEMGNAAGAHDAASAAVQKAKDAFIQLQPQADIASGKAQILADKLFGIPDDVATTVVANTQTADTQLAGIKNKLDAINGSQAVATVKVVQSVQVVGEAAVAAAQSILGKADGGMFEAGREVQHAANGLSRMVKGGANLVQWAEPETVWESYISGKPSQRTRNHGIMSQTASKLGGTYIPPGSVAQKFANGGLNTGAQASLSSSNVINSSTSRGDTNFYLTVSNHNDRHPIHPDELVRAVREAERRGRM